MSRKKRQVVLGTVSHGTMLEDDLIPAFISELEFYGKLKAARRFQREWEQIQENEDDDGAAELCEELFDALDAIAPPYVYFGAHPGDGSDYGFWPSWDALDDDPEDVLRVNAGDELPPLKDRPAYILEVNDHGNASLLTRRGREIWSVV